MGRASRTGEGEQDWGGRAGSQVAINDILDRHVVGAVHEMIAPDHTVSFLTNVPGTTVTSKQPGGELGPYISKCVKKSTSSLVVNGTSAPTVPRMPLYITASVPPVCAERKR